MNTQHNPTNELLQSLVKLPVLWLILFTQTSAVSLFCSLEVTLS